MQTTRVVETIVKLWLYFISTRSSSSKILSFRIFKIQIVDRIVLSKFSEAKKKNLLPRSIDQFSIRFKGKYPPWPFNKATNIGGMKFIGLSDEWFLTKNVGSRHQTKFYSACLGPCFDDKSFQRETQRDRQGNNRKRRGSVQETRFQATPGTISSKILQISGPWFFFSPISSILPLDITDVLFRIYI